MQKDHILKFLDHIFGRQDQFGVEDAFRFRIYIKKKTEYLAKYDRRPPAVKLTGKISKVTVKASGAGKELGEGSKTSHNEIDDTIAEATDESAEEAVKNLRAAIAEEKDKSAVRGTVGGDRKLNQDISRKYGKTAGKTVPAVEWPAAGVQAAARVPVAPAEIGHPADITRPGERDVTLMEKTKKGKGKQKKKDVTKAEALINLGAKKKLRSHLKSRQ
jgi:hypothetical protein